MAQALREITASRIVAVEGVDEVNFLGALAHAKGFSNIQFLDVAGKNSFQSRLEATLLLPGFSEVVSLGVIRDADDDANGAFQSIQQVLRTLGLGVPNTPLELTISSPSIAVYVMPGGNALGALEDLCFDSIGADPAFVCMEQYFECLGSKKLFPNSQLGKAKVHAFLASREKPDLRLGESAVAGFWPWDSGAYDEIVSFLASLPT